jgi:hypothetical protein
MIKMQNQIARKTSSEMDWHEGHGVKLLLVGGSGLAAVGNEDVALEPYCLGPRFLALGWARLGR